MVDLQAVACSTPLDRKTDWGFRGRTLALLFLKHYLDQLSQLLVRCL